MAKSFNGFNQPFEFESIEMTPPVAGSTKVKLFETSSCTTNFGKINFVNGIEQSQKSDLTKFSFWCRKRKLALIPANNELRRPPRGTIFILGKTLLRQLPPEPELLLDLSK